jgi:excisionase family DNA binding protein
MSRQGDHRTASEDDRGGAQRPLLDTRAAGRYTGLGERYIRRLRAERRIDCVRIGGRVLFDPDDLDRLIEQHRVAAIRPGGGG